MKQLYFFGSKGQTFEDEHSMYVNLDIIDKNNLEIITQGINQLAQNIFEDTPNLNYYNLDKGITYLLNLKKKVGLDGSLFLVLKDKYFKIVKEGEENILTPLELESESDEDIDINDDDNSDIGSDDDIEIEDEKDPFIRIYPNTDIEIQLKQEISENVFNYISLYKGNFKDLTFNNKIIFKPDINYPEGQIILYCKDIENNDISLLINYDSADIFQLDNSFKEGKKAKNIRIEGSERDSMFIIINDSIFSMNTFGTILLDDTYTINFLSCFLDCDNEFKEQIQKNLYLLIDYEEIDDE